MSVLHILRTIKERNAVSRTELQQLTQLSWGTITNTTRELLNRNFVREEAATSNRPGRKPVCLRVNTQNHCLVGLELAPECLRCLAVNLGGEELWYEETREGMGDAPAELLERMAALMARCLASPEVGQRVCMGVGVAVPGAVDVTQGVMRFAPRMPGWHEVKVRDYLQSRVQAPVRIDHNPNCLALAERWFGETGAAENVLCIHLGEGVGMGILINGDIYRGSEALAGEFGHMTLDVNGPACACGDHGCVEAYCSASAVAQHARELAGDGAALKTIPQLLDEARAGQGPARTSFGRMGRFLGIGIANLVDLFNADLIVLAGAMTVSHEFFMPTLNVELEKHAWKHSNRRLLISELGMRGTVLGACGMVLQSAFAHDLLDEEQVVTVA